jgi:hypothetical protein
MSYVKDGGPALRQVLIPRRPSPVWRRSRVVVENN